MHLAGISLRGMEVLTVFRAVLVLEENRELLDREAQWG